MTNGRIAVLVLQSGLVLAIVRGLSYRAWPVLSDTPFPVRGKGARRDEVGQAVCFLRPITA